MPEYLIMIGVDEAAMAAATPEDYVKMRQGHLDLQANSPATIVGGNRLHPTSSATTVRYPGWPNHSGDEPLVTDGPFAESKEALAGYYLIEADDLDQALLFAKATPAPFGSVEVRPVWPFE